MEGCIASADCDSDAFRLGFESLKLQEMMYSIHKASFISGAVPLQLLRSSPLLDSLAVGHFLGAFSPASPSVQRCFFSLAGSRSLTISPVAFSRLPPPKITAVTLDAELAVRQIGSLISVQSRLSPSCFGHRNCYLEISPPSPRFPVYRRSSPFLCVFLPPLFALTFRLPRN